MSKKSKKILDKILHDLSVLDGDALPDDNLEIPEGLSKYYNSKSPIKLFNELYRLKINKEKVLPFSPGAVERIYGEDNRVDLHSKKLSLKSVLTPSGKNADFLSAIEQNEKATVIIVKDEVLKPIGTDEKKYFLEGDLLKSKLQNKGVIFDPTKILFPYTNEFSANIRGSGFFIKKDLIVTAAHLFHKVKYKEVNGQRVVDKQDEDNILNYRAITGFTSSNKMVSSSKFPNVKTNAPYGTIIDSSQIFKPLDDRSSMHYGQDYSTNSRLDYAVLRVVPLNNENSYPGHFVKYQTKVFEKRDIYGIGYGLGLTSKVHMDSKITYSDSDDKYFTCCLDFFSGNSGSPVFDAVTHKVIGMLYAGSIDFKIIKNNVVKAPNTIEKEIQAVDHAEGEVQFELHVSECKTGFGELCQKMNVIIKQFVLPKI